MKIKIDEFLVARLSGKAGSLLLALLASRAPISSFTNKELMERTGLRERSVQRAKDELIQCELLVRDGHKLVLCDELLVFYSIVPAPAPPPSSASAPEPVFEYEEEETVEELCARADALKDKSRPGQQIAALDELWRNLFPGDRFPQARKLNAAAAREFLTLAGGSASTVYRYLHDIDTEGRDIPYPVGYCRSIIKRKAEDEKEKGMEATVDVDINDDWRAMAALAAGGTSKNGHKNLKGYKPHSQSGVPASPEKPA